MSCVPHPDRHSSMLNATASLAIAIQNFPNFVFSWSDSHLSEAVYSSVNDSQVKVIASFCRRATAYVMEFLVTV